MSLPAPSRVYTIVHYRSPDSGEQRFFLGIESVLHRKALAEMVKRLGSERGAAKRQRAAMRAQLATGEPVLGERGRVRSNGPFVGFNFGGTLLIGRPALAGGRVDRTDLSPEHAALRELVEELRLSTQLLDDQDLRRAALSALLPLCDIERDQPGKTVVERYYTLDISALCQSDAAMDAIAGPAAIRAGFSDDVDEAALSADSAEKRALLDLSAAEFIDELAGPLQERDRTAIEAGVGELRAALAGVLGVDVPDAFVDELVEFQASRRLDNQVAAARRFVEWLGVVDKACGV